MSASYFDQIFDNCDIMIYIYKLLNMDDQWRLSCVNQSLRNIFETYIVRETFHTMTIYNRNRYVYVLTNHTGVNRLCITHADLYELVQSCSADVKELILTCHVSLSWRKHFQNLRHLQCNWSELTIEDLGLIAEHLKQLESLHLEEFDCENQEDAIVDILLKIKNLKRLGLYHDQRNKYTIKYRNIHRLFTHLKLELFKTVSEVVLPNDDIMVIQKLTTNSCQLKELALKSTFDPNKWSQNYSSFLSNFSNLKQLDISPKDKMTDNIFNSLAQTCTHLETLSMRRGYFNHLDYIILPPKLQNLILWDCRFLSTTNLIQFLNGPTLKKFSSICTRYYGERRDFTISPNIQSLRIDYMNMELFKSIYANNLNLKEFTWNNGAGLKTYRHIATGDQLETCSNLETLDMRGQIEVEKLLQLIHLKTLYIPFLKRPHQWTYITDLLRKHTSLDELIIQYCIQIPGVELKESPPVAGFTTNLTRLTITRDIFELALDFWLDLCVRNKQMALKCKICIPKDEDFLKTLIYYEKFPSVLSKMDICGFNISK